MKDLFRTIPRLAGKTIELRALTQADADALDAFTHDDRVYRYLPTFLFERKYPTAAEAIGVLISYLERETDIEIVAASTMAVNPAAGEVLKKNGFTLVAHAAPEDWGFSRPVPTDKWIY